MAPNPKPKFSEGEKVLCFHGPLIYEAKCLKSSITKEKHVRYFIHYAGWNKNWDEWVPESRVLKYNEANVMRQKEVQKAHSAQQAKIKKTQAKGRKSEASAAAPREESRASTPAAESTATPGRPPKTQPKEAPAPDSGSDQPKKKRGRLDQSIESEEQYLAKVEVKIKIPEELKLFLVDDWDAINRQQKLVMLPAKVTVNQILDNYVASKKSSKAHSQSKDAVLMDIVGGVKEYFNVVIGSQLLYKFERPQYSEVLREGSAGGAGSGAQAGQPGQAAQAAQAVQPSAWYGAVHLLRLFVKLGGMLAYTALDERSLHHTLAQLHDLLRYLLANRATLLSLQDYGNAPPDYHRKVQ